MNLSPDQLEALAKLSFRSLMKEYMRSHPHGPDLTLYTWEMQGNDLKNNYLIMIADVLREADRLGGIIREKLT